MDPLADKLMVMAALVCFTYAGIVHPGVTIVILAREFLVTGLRALATTNGKVIAADILGKLKTVSQDVGIIVILAWQALEHAEFAPVHSLHLDYDGAYSGFRSELLRQKPRRFQRNQIIIYTYIHIRNTKKPDFCPAFCVLNL